MSKVTPIAVAVVLMFCTLSTRAANIVWVSFHGADTAPSSAAAAAGFTLAPDAGFTQLLRSHGHNVTRVVSSPNPDTNLLNTADLVILSRSAPSADYETDAQTAAWHGATTPMILLHGFVVRSNRLGFATGTNIIDTTAATIRLTASEPLHPIFAGITLGDNTVMTHPYAHAVSFNGVEQRGISVSPDALAGGGTILATVGTPSDAAYGGMVIAEWPPGATMATGDVLGGRRLMLLSGTREDLALTPEGTGIYNLSPAGADIFLNAVDYMARPTPLNYRNAVLDQGPIAYYSFDSGNTASNAGTLGAAANGLLLNGATIGAQAPAPPLFSGFESNNTALQLDGVDDYMRSASGLLNNYSNVTLSGWIRRSGTQRNRTGIFGQDNVVEFGYITNTTLQAWIDNFNAPVNVTNPFPNLEWEHVALVLNGATLRATVYTNSQVAASSALPSAYYSVNTNAFVVGGDVFGNGGVTFGGQIDEVAVFTNALSAEQVNDHYYSGAIRPPAIRRHPSSTNVFEDEVLRLSVQASGTPRLRYRWHFNGAPLDATGPTLVISNMIPELSGLYSVAVRNSYGLTQSVAATVNVVPTQPPTITEQPRSIVRYIGRDAAFTVSAGGPNLAYQWQFSGTNLFQATNATLFLDEISQAEAGAYRAIVSNSTGSTVSAEATLTVIQPSGTYDAGILLANPIAYWRLGETSGTTAFDAWGGFDGTYTNVTRGVASPLLGDANAAAGFNGTNSAVTTPLSLNSTPAFTIMGWFQRGGNLPNRSGLWGQNDRVEIGFITNHILQAWTGLPLDINPSPFPNGEWVHLTVASDGATGSLQIYTNGVSAVSRSHTMPADNPFTFNIGGGGVFDPTGNFFKGNIDEVAVFNYQLTSQQITDIYFARGHAPIALCQNVTNIVCGGCSAAVDASEVDNGSYDPDGTAVVMTLAPPGPYAPGVHHVALVVADPWGATNACPATIVVIEQFPPVANVAPAVTNVPPGGSAIFCADVSGVGPFEFQWRHNGVNIPGATNACLSITNVDLVHGGNYTVAIANNAGAIIGGPAQLLLDLPAVQGSDSLTNRTFVGGDTGAIAGTNTTAAADPGEPRHSGKPGGKSIWYEWSSTESGVATFSTLGSTFDTLLAIYVQCGPSNLVEIASDDDGDSNLTSRVRFNVIEGTNYLVAVDGFGGADGQFSLNWKFEPVPLLLPVIAAHPGNVTVAPAEPASFSVNALPGCETCQACSPGATNPVALTYQWYRDGAAVVGATNALLEIPAAQESDVGNYAVEVTQSGQAIRSHSAALQLNITGPETQPVQARNKFEEAAEAPGIELGVGGAGPPPPPDGGIAAAPSTVVRGYTGTQVFSTAASTTESGDIPVCGVIGGASQWLTFVPLQTGLLHLNTDGSTYNTVLAVFVRSATNASILRFVECDNNSGADGRDSALDVPVQAGMTNFIMIDGVNGQTGTLRLNYSLVITSAITFLGTTPEGFPRLRVSGRPELRFALELSTNMTTWAPLITTNATSGTLDVIDTTIAPGTQRLYRARMLP